MTNIADAGVFLLEDWRCSFACSDRTISKTLDCLFMKIALAVARVFLFSTGIIQIWDAKPSNFIQNLYFCKYSGDKN